MSSKTPTCPVCLNSATLKSTLNGAYLKAALETYFQTAADNIHFIDYETWTCNTCELEFANPMEPGSNEYYTWLSKRNGYYPPDRWEFPLALSMLSEKSKQHQVNLVEIGCGSGVFLQKLSGKNNIVALGVDTTATAVEACRQKGLEAFCGTLSDYHNEYPDTTFDVACSFHCLEHVPDPLEFMMEIKSVLKVGGTIIISTPYSPMSFERSWFDPMNHPPHHMTRWNKRSYEKLAEILGMKVELQTSTSLPIKQRVKEAFGFSHKGPGSIANAVSLKKELMKSPLEVTKEFIYQKKRDVVGNKVAGNAVLAVFYNE